ncbi:collagen alpha-6(VI) chain-like [Mercenaria mercenaria]|uniref:collagen alpha-6(VI) chain-like n=1 Tax=Mercenaria mercenaria TaxID=6596 RepID=UPI00234F94C7|nr:collagen alpha-6(VI) chain-like [Mercenaria mercenaria]
MLQSMFIYHTFSFIQMASRNCKMIFVGIIISLFIAKTYGYDGCCDTRLKQVGCIFKTLPEMTSCSSLCDDGIQFKIEIACCSGTYQYNCRDYNNGHCILWYWWINDDQVIDILNRNTDICPHNETYMIWFHLEKLKCDQNPCQNNGTCTSTGGQYTCNCDGTGFYGVNCETDECKPIPTDVVFVLDSSTSMTENEFYKQLQFVSTFINHVEIGPTDFRVGIVTFSSDAKVEFGFNDYLTNDTLKAAIELIKFSRGVTFTHLGLASAEAMFKNKSMSNNASATRKKYVFVLTDGMSSNRKKTESAALSLKKIVHKVITIGIGYEVSHRELLTISSPPDDLNAAYVFSVDDFNSLNTILKELVQLTCDKCESSSFSDVIFLIDTSFYIADTDFQIAISSITYIIQHLKSMDITKGTDVGILTYDAHNSKIVLPLNHTMDKIDILPYLQLLTREEATCEKDECHVESINETMSIFHEALFDFRNDSRRFIVILTNGKFGYAERPLSKLIARLNGIYDVNLYVIGLGDDVNMEGLLSLVNDANHVFITSDDSYFTHLDVLQAAFTYNECDLH